MHILLNGYPIENVEDPAEIANVIFSSIFDLNYWSYEALEELYIGVFAIIAEYCKEKIKTCSANKKRKYMKFISTDRMKYLSKSRRRILAAIYEFILSSENLSRCHGFGFSNKFGDKTQGNAEWTRLTKRRKGD